MEHFSTKMTKNAPILLVSATFPERDFRLAKYQVFHQETQENGKSKSRSENIVFPNENGALFDKNDKNASIELDFTTFSERDFRHAKYQVFPSGNSRKWKVKIAF